MCPEESFNCSNNCISWDYVCDGIRQCPNGEDEHFCGKCVNNNYVCIDNNSEMDCSKSCSILGYIPCKKYRNRITCLRDYPNALGQFNNNYNQNSLINSWFKSTTFIIFGSILIVFILLLVLVVFLCIYRRRYKSCFYNSYSNKQILSTSNSNNNVTTIVNNVKDNSSKYKLVNNVIPTTISTTTTTTATIQRHSCGDNKNIVENIRNKISKHEYIEDLFDNNEHKYDEIDDVYTNINHYYTDNNNEINEPPQVPSAPYNRNEFYYSESSKLEHQPPPYNQIDKFETIQVAAENSQNCTMKQVRIDTTDIIYGKSTCV